jgi:hypothetical protein
MNKNAFIVDDAGKNWLFGTFVNPYDFVIHALRKRKSSFLTYLYFQRMMKKTKLLAGKMKLGFL